MINRKLIALLALVAVSSTAFAEQIIHRTTLKTNNVYAKEVIQHYYFGYGKAGACQYAYHVQGHEPISLPNGMTANVLDDELDGVVQVAGASFTCAKEVYQADEREVAVEYDLIKNGDKYLTSYPFSSVLELKG